MLRQSAPFPESPILKRSVVSARPLPPSSRTASRLSRAMWGTCLPSGHGFNRAENQRRSSGFSRWGLAQPWGVGT